MGTAVLCIGRLGKGCLEQMGRGGTSLVRLRLPGWRVCMGRRGRSLYARVCGTPPTTLPT